VNNDQVDDHPVLIAMNKFSTILIMLLIPMISFGQDAPLSIFDHVISKTWKATGNWGDGSQFKQEIEFKYSLDSTIVIANAIGFVDQAQTKLGLRNHGIRQYDKTSGSIKFWEFDVFGGLTEGVVFAEGKNIIYQYAYGESTITDMWEYVDDTTYNFKVGSYKDGAWEQVYLETQFIQIKSE